MLKSLDDYNREHLEAHRKADEPQPTGIACPECGAELMENPNGVVLTSNPPQVGVFCKCGFRGTRFQ